MNEVFLSGNRTNCLEVKNENKRFANVGTRCRPQIWSFQFGRFTGNLDEMYLSACRLCSKNIFPFWANSIVAFVALVVALRFRKNTSHAVLRCAKTAHI